MCSGNCHLRIRFSRKVWQYFRTVQTILPRERESGFRRYEDEGTWYENHTGTISFHSSYLGTNLS